MADIAPEKVEWLWDGRIPRGKLTLLDGDPGLGKSTLVCELAACLSTGRLLPGQSAPVLVDVLLASAEDGAGDTIRPRLDAAGADVSRVHILRGGLEIARSLAALEDGAHARNVRLIVLDPLMAYLGTRTNSHNDQEVRQALAPLADMAERLGAAVLAIRHLNKQPGAQALYRGGGSIGIAAAARSVLLLAKDPENPSLRILASIKNNLAVTPPALRLRMESTGDSARIGWLGECEIDADSLTALPDPDKSPSRVEVAEGFIRCALAQGSIASTELEDRALLAGISTASLRRARAKLSVASYRKDNRLFIYLGSPQPAQPAGVAQVEQVEHVAPFPKGISQLVQLAQPERGADRAQVVQPAARRTENK